GVGGTYARWADGASAEGATLTTGTAALGARWTDEGQDSVWQNLLPGESAVRELTLENTGAVPLEVTTTLADGAPSLEILAGGAPVRLEPGQHLTFPVELAATEHLHPGDEIAVEVLLEGRQIRCGPPPCCTVCVALPSRRSCWSCSVPAPPPPTGPRRRVSSPAPPPQPSASSSP